MTIMAKSRSAVDRAMQLLAIEQSIEPQTTAFIKAHSVAEQKAYALIQNDVQMEKFRAIRESKAKDNSNKNDRERKEKDNSNKNDYMDEIEEKEGSEEVDSSGGKESLTSNHKRRETIDKLIMQLPPHGGKGCITNIQDDETIDKLISRIPTSE